jgi:hypothetical protein
MTSNPKFTAFTCRAAALALGVVPLAPSDRMQGRPGTSRPPAEAASAITRAKKAVPAGCRRAPKFRSRNGCLWLAKKGFGFETG